MKKLFSIMSNLQTHYHFKLDLRKVDQHTGRKWLIHGPKHYKDVMEIILTLLAICFIPSVVVNKTFWRLLCC